MQSRTQYGFLFQDHESHPEKKRAWNEDVQEDGNVKRQRVERSDGQGNDRRKSDAAVDLTRYREDQTGDDYSEEYILDGDALRWGDNDLEYTAIADAPESDAPMSDISDPLVAACQPPPTFFAVDDEDDVELDDQLKTDLLEYINSSTPGDSRPSSSPRAPVIMRPRWHSPGPSPLFQDHLVDQYVTDSRCAYGILCDSVKEDAEHPYSFHSFPKWRPQNGRISIVSPPRRRVLNNAIRRFKTDTIGLHKRLHYLRACAWRVG
ncbi:hypothetical protein ONZ51_g3633 [Trametes cubensis]|uniref:Uncharacterized protein n=1 Tax=Trametes cubensis TaxID=1111947 RepID=A0AAD7TZS3_9APHY|nr:hypothetical protein ONZ51_g3633 [Trametes cubensis]